MNNPFFANHCMRIVLSILLALVPLYRGAHGQQPNRPGIAQEDQAVLDNISADSLRGHLSFIASDLLKGRDSPSRGLDIAAEYIAAQFRRSGLEPIGDDGYFQTANMIERLQQRVGFSLLFSGQGRHINVPSDHATIYLDHSLKISHARLFKLAAANSSVLTSIVPAQVAGQVIITDRPISGWMDRRDVPSRLKPSLVIRVIRVIRLETRQLLDPESRRLQQRSSDVPFLVTNNKDVVAMFDAMNPGLTNATVSLRAPAALEKSVKLRNVVGLLRGSDQVLKDTYVFVTAHYDHLGVDRHGRIYNGANDNGSGVVSVIELASAFATGAARPRRSVVFMAFFGEEKREIGSQFYLRHSILPLEKTIADVNLEQLGRTDSPEGPEIASSTVTGFDFSDMTETFQAAGRLTGIRIYKHEQFSDLYFLHSDNGPFAEAGIPAHTLGVLFQFPDYHDVGDKSSKIDYDNMAKVNRMLALGVMMLANASTTPKWNEKNAKTASYVEAWKRRHQH